MGVCKDILTVTEKDEQTHADGQDGARTERGETKGFDLADLTPLAPEALQTAALVALGGVSQAGATVTTCGGAAGGGGAMQKTCDLIHHCNLIGWTPGEREWTLK